jgi:hypothetical protein
VHALIGRLDHKRLRPYVIYALGEIGSAARDAVPELTTYATRKGRVGEEARAALAKIQGPP